jgi:4-azaleucine resistance transporter AzlC
MKEINSFKKGIFFGIPICIGYFSVSFAFGIFSIKNGLTLLETCLISLTNLTSAGQLAAVPIIASGGSFIELALTQFIINSRYALMSLSLSQKLGKSVNLLDRFLISFSNTDEVFAIATSNKLNVGEKFMYGLAIPPIVGWNLGTLVGGVAGDVLPNFIASALSIAIYGMFIAIVIPNTKKDKSILYCVMISVILSCILNFMNLNIPSGFIIIICALISSTIMAIISPIEESEENDG